MLLGYSTGVLFPKVTSVLEAARAIYKVEQDIIEINLAYPEDVLQIDDNVTSHIKKMFRQVVIHAPFRDVFYSSKDRKLLLQIKNLSDIFSSNYVVFHPDVVSDFTLLSNIFESNLAFENMDRNKKFGNTVDDLKKVFHMCPQAKWLCDLNHVFTLDPTMNLYDALHSAFSSRLVGYHVSNYSGANALHTQFVSTENLIILSKLKSCHVSIIHEGIASSSEQLSQEYQFVKSTLQTLSTHASF